MDVGLFDLLVKAVRHPEVPLAFAAGCVLLGASGWTLAGQRGWTQLPAALAGCGLALALAVTVVRPAGHFPAGGLNLPAIVRECVVGDLSLTRTYEKLNVAMLMPFAFFATLATRRPAVVTACCVLLSGFVELVQGATGGGTCQARDVVHNAAGGALGALLAVVLQGVLTRRRRAARRSGISAGCGAGPASPP
ncbi:MAG TPA: VanZ family protein [Pseudonocardiaceae bacterium]|nr:VanZ family protein [Pseudonocardiaceae bacterium]